MNTARAGLVIDDLGWSSGWSVPPELMTGN